MFDIFLSKFCTGELGVINDQGTPFLFPIFRKWFKLKHY